MTVHEKPVGATVEWFTPPELFDSLGISFDLDPASPDDGPVPWIPAKRFVSAAEDGLLAPWKGRVWLNPPYGPAGAAFMRRMAEHRNGLLLVAARTETRAFQEAAEQSDRVVFLRDRLHFIRADGFRARATFGSVLMAFGHVAVGAVERADLGWAA